MPYIVAHPDSLVTFDTVELAREWGDECRKTHAVKLYELREIEHVFPIGPPAPEPVPPGTPVAAALEEPIAVAA